MSRRHLFAGVSVKSKRRWAILRQSALVACRLARRTDFATVPDQGMAEKRPLLARNQLDQVLFDSYGILLIARAPSQSKAMRQATDVSIDHHADVFFEPGAEYDIRSLSGDPRDFQ